MVGDLGGRLAVKLLDAGPYLQPIGGIENQETATGRDGREMKGLKS